MQLHHHIHSVWRPLVLAGTMLSEHIRKNALKILDKNKTFCHLISRFIAYRFGLLKITLHRPLAIGILIIRLVNVDEYMRTKVIVIKGRLQTIVVLRLT